MKLPLEHGQMIAHLHRHMQLVHATQDALSRLDLQDPLDKKISSMSEAVMSSPLMLGIGVTGPRALALYYCDRQVLLKYILSFGSDFVQALAEAFALADDKNRLLMSIAHEEALWTYIDQLERANMPIHPLGSPFRISRAN